MAYARIPKAQIKPPGRFIAGPDEVEPRPGSDASKVVGVSAARAAHETTASATAAVCDCRCGCTNIWVFNFRATFQAAKRGQLERAGADVGASSKWSQCCHAQSAECCGSGSRSKEKLTPHHTSIAPARKADSCAIFGTPAAAASGMAYKAGGDRDDFGKLNRVN